MLRIAEFPQLKEIACDRRGDDVVSDKEALSLYERNWRFVDQRTRDANERNLIDRLVRDYGHGVLNF
jgi:hypothetical protein